MKRTIVLLIVLGMILFLASCEPSGPKVTAGNDPIHPTDHISSSVI